MKQQPHVTIYTDGACSGNPGAGGWAAVLLAGKAKKEISGAVAQTTNNRMELTAVIKALESLNRACQVELHSDSAYIINAFNNNWLKSWQAKGWKNAAGNPVANQDLWKALLELSAFHTIQWIKVKGHADNDLNNRCDELAVAAVKQLKAEQTQTP
ncbi:ribonuclease HI [Oscillospiraceae bacterium HV4-5-C5C]|nr:ribonuclease HI [Oscillospiraceae bacterium HV4-5-C5C]